MDDSIMWLVAEKAPRVTTHNEHGEVGLGRLVDGRVYVSGNLDGWYYYHPELTYDEDNGKGYWLSIKHLFLLPLKRALGWKD